MKGPLTVRDLEVRFPGAARPILADVGFSIAPGSTVGVVGPSGAGKSTLALAIMRLLPRGATLGARSEVHLDDVALHTLDLPALRALRGRRIAMVFQEPLLALDPAMSLGAQVAETALVHGIPPVEARDRALTMLSKVGFADPRSAAALFPHELSGGMRQRALIASAMMLAPAVLIADEPTTALDPTIQAQVLDLLDRLREEAGTTLLLISHDLAVVAERCARVIALEGGRIVQDAAASEVLRSRRGARGAATALTRSIVPEAGDAVTTGIATAGAPLLQVRDLRVEYRARPALLGPRATVTAVDSLSITLARGEVLGLVGESGCGKTSAAHAILRLIEPTAGQLSLDGTDIRALAPEALRRFRRRMQLVPQDAGASLTPHLTSESLVAEALEVHGLARGDEARRRARVLLDEVGLPSRAARALPRELSSGERQRVAIARALGPEPDLLLCDEPLAAVDLPTRERLLTLLESLRRSRGLSMLFISHDLEAVSRLASRVIVMYLGRVVESSVGASALLDPQMPYTRALAAAVPTGDPATPRRRIVLQGELPSRGAPPRGCAFHPRCPHPAKDDQCSNERPPLVPVVKGDADHLAACWKIPLPPDQ